MVEIAEMHGQECCASVNNAPWISTPIEQKSDLSFQWALHMYFILDQKLLSFEVQFLLFFFVFSDCPSPKWVVQAHKLSFRREATSAVLQFMFLQCFDYTKVTWRPNHLSLEFFHFGIKQYGSLQTPVTMYLVMVC